ncbi:MAG: hypothetical protein JSS49_24355 [Planctomycetes bacterium]|nr:hypothetical protein [Planctomycetota bacterium]
MRRFHRALSIVATLLAAPVIASAQMVTTQAPLHSNGSSFYEYSHIGWGVHNPHYFMNFNGGGGAPPFGGYQPNAGLHGGFAVGNSQFDFGFGQGSSIYSTSTTPVLTTTSGFPGYMFIGRDRPFVTGVAPVVGGGGGFASVPPMGPLTSRMATGQLRTENGRIVPALDAAGIPPAPEPQADIHGAADRIVPPRTADSRPAVSRTVKADLTPAQYLERGTAAAQEGRSGVARIYFQLAATKGDAVIKAEANRKISELK